MEPKKKKLKPKNKIKTTAPQKPKNTWPFTGQVAFTIQSHHNYKIAKKKPQLIASLHKAPLSFDIYIQSSPKSEGFLSQF